MFESSDESSLLSVDDVSQGFEEKTFKKYLSVFSGCLRSPSADLFKLPRMQKLVDGD